MFLNLAMLAFHPPVSVSGALTRDTHLVSGLESEARSWVSKLGLHAYFMGQVSTHELPLASAGGGGAGGARAVACRRSPCCRPGHTWPCAAALDGSPPLQTRLGQGPRLGVPLAPHVGLCCSIFHTGL